MIDFPNEPIEGDVFYNGSDSWIYVEDGPGSGQWTKRTGYIDTIGQLKDVELTFPQSGDQLVWSMNKFVNQQPPAPAISEQNKNYPSNRYIFKVNNSKTTLVDGTDGIIKFDQVQFDPSNVFDEVNYKFVAPVDGHYKIGVSVVYSNTYFSNHCYMYIDDIKFGTMFSMGTYSYQGGNVLSKSTLIKLNQNQTVSMYYKMINHKLDSIYYQSYDLLPHVDTEFFGYLYRGV